MIEFVDYNTIDPFSVRAPTKAKGLEFDRDNRFQMLALEGPSRLIVGRWAFSATRRAGQVWISSIHTWTVQRLRNRGVATRLWSLGIEVYRPCEISVAVVSHGGAALVARMRARVAGTPTRLDVYCGTGEDGYRETYERLSAAAAESEIRELRNPRRPPAKKLEVVK